MAGVPRLPDGDPAPASGELPAAALARWRGARFGVYLHVPFCSVRCGYCDFNTYTLAELGPGASPTTSPTTALRELDLAGGVLGDAAGPDRTPSSSVAAPRPCCPPADLVRLVDGIRERFGLADGRRGHDRGQPRLGDARRPRGAGRRRLHPGQHRDAVRRARTCCATLDRTHDPARVATAVARRPRGRPRDVSVDLIYGTPGESLDDWRASLEAALALEPDHVLGLRARRRGGHPDGRAGAPRRAADARRRRRGRQVRARRRARSSAAGYDWYEVSNWARDDAARCRHNEGYWRGRRLVGHRPGGAQPRRRRALVERQAPRAPTPPRSPPGGRRPPAARRSPTEQRHDEVVLLGVRLREGLPLDVLDATGRTAVAGLVADGLVDGRAAVAEQRVVLTRRGRLLADAVVRRLLGV